MPPVERLTFEQARAAVRAEYEHDYSGPGTFYVDTSGLVDVLDFLVPWGAREWIVDRDPDFIAPTGVCTFVDRRSGAVRDEEMPVSFEKIDAMEACST